MTAINIEAARALLTRLETATEHDREIDRAVWHDVQGERRPGKGFQANMSAVPRYTASLDAAVALVERVLPAFYQSSGLCALSGHASIGPDYNGPDAERLRREWPEVRFHEGFHADLKPGDGRHRQCLSLIHCALQALIACAETGAET